MLLGAGAVFGLLACGGRGMGVDHADLRRRRKHQTQSPRGLGAPPGLSQEQGSVFSVRDPGLAMARGRPRDEHPGPMCCLSEGRGSVFSYMMGPQRGTWCYTPEPPWTAAGLSRLVPLWLGLGHGRQLSWRWLCRGDWVIDSCGRDKRQSYLKRRVTGQTGLTQPCWEQVSPARP